MLRDEAVGHGQHVLERLAYSGLELPLGHAMFRPVLKLLVLLAAVLPHAVLAKLVGEAREEFVVAMYYACLAEKGPTSRQLLSEADQASRPRLCNCATYRLADVVDAESLERIKTGQGTIDSGLISDLVQSCKERYMEYGDTPPVAALALAKDTNGSVLFGGKVHRFTAFRQHVYTKEFQFIRTVELSNGRYLFDLRIGDGRHGSLIDVATRKQYSLAPHAGANKTAESQGYDHTFVIKEQARSGGVLAIDSRRNVLVTQLFNEEHGLWIETHYVRSQALICTALEEAKTRALKSAAVSIFKEVLLAAVKSYAGASYSGGNFTAYTSTGQTVSGTYTRYDSSWLGEHYSRGLDAVFEGTASLADINREMARLKCEELAGLPRP